jgi:23S rRNA (uridine2552-2'-O)-methyltransferase
MGRRWVAERRRDRYYRAAQEEGLRSRAAFKLRQLQERFHVLRPGDQVLDLGAAPGGWSLVAQECVGPSGTVVAVDLRPVERAPGLVVLRGSVSDPRLRERLREWTFDVVLSDMSPRISGNYAMDHARSVALVEDALGVAHEVLRSGGSFVAKVFQGDLLEDLLGRCRTGFDRVQVTKPAASRDPSSEMYLLAWGHRSRGPLRGPMGGTGASPGGGT